MISLISLVAVGTIREERRMPEQDLTDGKMMNVNDNRQTRRTLVYSNGRSPQISSQIAA
jgi:hypothetical protein